MHGWNYLGLHEERIGSIGAAWKWVMVTLFASRFVHGTPFVLCAFSVIPGYFRLCMLIFFISLLVIILIRIQHKPSWRCRHESPHTHLGGTWWPPGWNRRGCRGRQRGERGKLDWVKGLAMLLLRFWSAMGGVWGLKAWRWWWLWGRGTTIHLRHIFIRWCIELNLVRRKVGLGCHVGVVCCWLWRNPRRSRYAHIIVCRQCSRSSPCSSIWPFWWWDPFLAAMLSMSQRRVWVIPPGKIK